uniref:Uncharacterized protein n=1 Tax=Ciona savignyi TaxID=51511 RepID=H2Z3Q8_CIOSA
MQFTFDTYAEMAMYFDYFNAEHNLAWRKTKTGLKKRNLERQELLDVLKIKTSISWSSKRDTSIKYDSVPYIWLGIDTYICQYGPDVDLKIKEKYRLKTERKVMDDQPYKRRKRRISKKLGCRAVAKMIHIIKLPKYRVETNSTLYSRNQAAAKFHTDLKNGDVEKIEMNQMFILYFSDIDQHNGHPILGVENQSRSDEMVKKEKFIMNNAIQRIPAVDRRLKVVLNGSGYPKKERKQNRRHPRTIINVLCEVDSTQRDSD